MSKYRKITDLLDEHLNDEEFATEFLSQAIKEDLETFLMSLEDVIRAHGSITKIAEKAGVNRATIYKLFSKGANPELGTLEAVLHAIGYKLSITKIAENQSLLNSSSKSKRLRASGQ